MRSRLSFSLTLSLVACAGSSARPPTPSLSGSPSAVGSTTAAATPELGPYADGAAERADEPMHILVSALLSHARRPLEEGQRPLGDAIDVDAARTIDEAAEVPPREREALVVSLRDALRLVPPGCEPVVYLEPSRLDLPPPFEDAPLDRAATIDRARDLLGASTQVVVTCAGHARVAIAFASRSASWKVIAWSDVREGGGR